MWNNSACGQGECVFYNGDGGQTIMVDGALMPVSTERQFLFAVFLAPSATVDVAGVTPAYADPSFQFAEAGAYTTNSPSRPGRVQNRVLWIGASQGLFIGSTVDFVVRGWSANAGATWAEALATWNNGSPLVPMYIGSSTIGNNFVLGGGAGPTPGLFGFDANQIQGFNLALIPEPSPVSFGLLGLGLLWLRVGRPTLRVKGNRQGKTLKRT